LDRADAAEAELAALRDDDATPREEREVALKAERDAALARATSAEKKLTERSGRLSELRDKLDDRRKDTDGDAALVLQRNAKQLRDAERRIDELSGDLVNAKLQVAELSAELDNQRRLQRQPTALTPTASGNGGASSGGFFSRRPKKTPTTR